MATPKPVTFGLIRVEAIKRDRPARVPAGRYYWRARGPAKVKVDWPADVDRWLTRKQVQQQLLGRLVLPEVKPAPSAEPTLEDLMRRWLAAVEVGKHRPGGRRQPAPATLVSYRDGVQALLGPEEQRDPIAQLPLSSLNARDAGRHFEAWMARYKASDARAKYIFARVKQALRWAVSVGLLESMPRVGWPDLRPKRTIDRWVPGDHHIAAALEHLTNPWARMAFLWQLHTGCRIQEVALARWQDINDGVWHVRDVPGCKTGARDVPLSGELANLIAEWRSDPWRLDWQQRRPSDRVLGVTTGTAHTQSGSYYHEACKAAGIRQIRTHDLRHRFITVLLDRGAGAVPVAALVGDTVKTILSVYAHALPSAKSSAVEMASTSWRPRPELVRGTG